MLGERVEAKYSGSDTDSDTEEYCANAHMINPVTGHVEPLESLHLKVNFLRVFISYHISFWDTGSFLFRFLMR